MSSTFKTGLLPALDGNRDEGVFPVYAPAGGNYSPNDLKDIFAARKRSRLVMPFSRFGTNQNPYSSCAAHGLRNGFVRDIFARTGNFIDLQPHSAYAWVNGGSDNGAALSACMKEIETKGMLTTADARKEQIYLSQYPKELWKKALRFRGHAFEARDKESYLTGLARGLFGAVAVDVNNSYMNWNGNGLTPFGFGNGNHCVCCDDAEWNSQTGDFDLTGPGSWGEQWGQDGYWRNGWNAFQRTVQYHSFYLLEGSFDDPEDETQPPAVS